jgi:predicted permease
MSPGELWRKLWFLLRRSEHLNELDEEMRLHLELRERQLREQGVAPDEAFYTARRQFGNVTQVSERSQGAWGWNWFHGFSQDLRYALRLLRANPVFSAVAILTLALGIGPNTAIFSVMNTLVLRSLPVPEPDRLVYLRTSHQPRGTHNTGNFGSSFSFDVYAHLRGRQEAFSDLMAFVPLGVDKVAVRYGTIPEEASASMVSGNFFTGLGVRAACGRLLAMEDETHRAAVAVLSHAYWSLRFNEDCGVVGQTIWVKGVPLTIAGVAAKGFIGVESVRATDVWLPFQDRPELNAWGMRRNKTYLHSPEWWCLLLLGRLAPGLSEEAAVARLQPAYVDAAYAHIGQPRRDEKIPMLAFVSTRGIPGLRDVFEQPLRLLLSIVGVVLVIACANVALLLIARNAVRQREFGVRLAVGGGRMRLLRQLLTESLVLVGAGACLGWFFGLAATKALSTWSGLELDLTPDGRVLIFTLAVSVLTALIFGLAPLRSSLRVPLNTALKASAATAHQQSGRTLGRKAVVGVQVALCLMLLVGAGLLVRTLHNIEQIPLGIRTTGLLVFGITPPQHLQSHAETVRFYESLLNRIRALGNVESVTLMQNRIGSGWSNNTSVFVDGRNPQGDRNSPVRWNAVGPAYFATLGTPLLYGRDILESDALNAPKIAIVNETFIKRYLAGRNPLDHSIALSTRKDAPQYRITGVAADGKYTGVREQPAPMAYFSYKQMEHVSEMHVEVRTAGDPKLFLPVLQRDVREIAPDAPLEQLRTQQQQFAVNLAQERLVARLALFFGLLAIVLVATGLYGTLAYSVNRRTSEIGLRVALGAQKRDVLWMILRESLVVCLVGIAVGLPLAIAGSRVLRSMLYGVEPGDPITFLISLLGLVAVAAISGMLPAYRATSVDPVKALRTE